MCSRILLLIVFENTTRLYAYKNTTRLYARHRARPSGMSFGVGNDHSHLISEILQLISEANQLIS